MNLGSAGYQEGKTRIHGAPMKRGRAQEEPTAESLREIPEHDFSRNTHWRPGVARERLYTLALLRGAYDLTQAQIAKRAKMTQSDVSRSEQRTDCLVSTLERYAKALGGRLRLVVEIDDRSYLLALQPTKRARLRDGA